MLPRIILLVILHLVLHTFSPAHANEDDPLPASDTPPIPLPFDQGSYSVGFIFGISGGQRTTVTLGGDVGYFILPGLEPGLSLEVSFGSDQPTITRLTPYTRWFFWRSYALSPFVKFQSGRWFISDSDDLWQLGGGGGIVFFLSRTVGLQLEGIVYRLWPSHVCESPSESFCTGYSLGVSFRLTLGG